MLNAKTALILGVSGQDGAYLAAFLLRQGYVVYGTSRDAESSSFENLRRPQFNKFWDIASKGIEYKPLPSDDPRQRRPDISLATATLGWTPITKLDTGLQNTVEYFTRCASVGQ